MRDPELNRIFRIYVFGFICKLVIYGVAIYISTTQYYILGLILFAALIGYTHVMSKLLDEVKKVVADLKAAITKV
jgi:hypothetical protein